MAKISTTTLKKNLERNIETFDEGVTDRSRQSAAFITQAVMILFAILFPLCILCFSANVAFRIPDVYSFDLGRTLSAKVANIDMENRALAEEISKYMLHSNSVSELDKNVINTDGETAFKSKDLKTLTAYRKSLDISFLVFGVSLALSVALYIFMLYTKRKRTLRRSFLLSFAGLAGWFGILCALLLRTNKRMQVFAGGSITPEDTTYLLSKLFDTKMFMEMTLLMLVISLLILFTMNSVTRALTKEPVLF